MKTVADKIASATRNVKLQRDLLLSPDIICQEGYVVAVRALQEKSHYNTIELVSGRMSRICKGDIIAGVLGPRHALRGYSGKVPDRLAVGDTIQILNLGGVFGECTSENPELGPPINVEVLGAVLNFPSFHHRIGAPAHIQTSAVQPLEHLPFSAPLVIVSGTCMNSGKTRAACELIKYLSASGLRVAAAKLSGISLMRDTLEMSDFGATAVLNFTDAGVVCSGPHNVLAAAKGIVASLSATKPDCIVLELGDGIMGEYGVMNLLLDQELMSYVRAHVLAANDPVGAWGAVHYLRDKCPAIDVITGPATDNEVGKQFIETKLGVLAANSIKDPELLASIAINKLNAATSAYVGNSV